MSLLQTIDWHRKKIKQAKNFLFNKMYYLFAYIFMFSVLLLKEFFRFFCSFFPKFTPKLGMVEAYLAQTCAKYVLSLESCDSSSMWAMQIRMSRDHTQEKRLCHTQYYKRHKKSYPFVLILDFSKQFLCNWAKVYRIFQLLYIRKHVLHNLYIR